MSESNRLNQTLRLTIDHKLAIINYFLVYHISDVSLHQTDALRSRLWTRWNNFENRSEFDAVTC